MANKRKFTNGFLTLENEVKQETVAETPLEEKQEIEKVESVNKTEIVVGQPVETTTIKKEMSITDIVNEKLVEAENRIDLFYNRTTGFGMKDQKPKFSEMYAGITISMNRDLNKIIEYLADNSTFTKTQIIEMLLVEGLKSIKFE